MEYHPASAVGFCIPDGTSTAYAELVQTVLVDTVSLGKLRTKGGKEVVILLHTTGNPDGAEVQHLRKKTQQELLAMFPDEEG